MKKIFALLASAMLNQWLAQPSAPYYSQIPIENPALDYIKSTMRRFAWLALVTTAASILFLANFMMMIWSVAWSYDAFGQFIPGAVFFTGLTLSITSLVVIALCGWAIANRATAIRADEIQRMQAPLPRRPGSFIDIAEPMIRGLISGWLAKKRGSYPYRPESSQEYSPSQRRAV